MFDRRLNMQGMCACMLHGHGMHRILTLNILLEQFFFRMAWLLLQCVTIPAAFFYFLFHSVCFYALRLQLHLQTHTQQHCVGQSYFFLLLLEAKKYQELHSIFNYWQRKFLSNIFFCFSLCSAVVFFLTVCVRAKFN